MSADLYYTAPSDAIFQEMKDKAIALWRTFDDTYGYASGKIARVEQIQNVGDNYMFIVAMFDASNQRRLLASCSETTRERINQALKEVI